MRRVLSSLLRLLSSWPFLLPSEFLWLRVSIIWPLHKFALWAVSFFLPFLFLRNWPISYGLSHCLLSWSPSPGNEPVTQTCLLLFIWVWGASLLTNLLPSHWPLYPFIRGFFFLMHLVISVAYKHGPRIDFSFTLLRFAVALILIITCHTQVSIFPHIYTER